MTANYGLLQTVLWKRTFNLLNHSPVINKFGFYACRIYCPIDIETFGKQMKVTLLTGPFIPRRNVHSLRNSTLNCSDIKCVNLSHLPGTPLIQNKKEDILKGLVDLLGLSHAHGQSDFKLTCLIIIKLINIQNLSR